MYELNIAQQLLVSGGSDDNAYKKNQECNTTMHKNNASGITLGIFLGYMFATNHLIINPIPVVFSCIVGGIVGYAANELNNYVYG